MGNAMGEEKTEAPRVDFYGQIRLAFLGVKLTSDAGLFALRELDEALELAADIDASGIQDCRTGENTRHNRTALLRQSVNSRLAGYEDRNDAERLCVDSAMRHLVGGRATEKTVASTSQIDRFETEMLTVPEITARLLDLPGDWLDRVRRCTICS
jgi:hypothetical protein